MKKLMTIFAHQDDETFSAGGILAKYNKNAYAVSVTFDPKRENEFRDACSNLGIKPVQLKFKNVSALNEIEIKIELVNLIQKLKPDHIITHVDFDYHHEHRFVRKIVEEAVEWASHTTNPDIKAHQVESVWAAETTVMIPFPEIYVDISTVNKKRLLAIECYESQSGKGGKGFYSKFHNTRTKLRGIQAGVEHAEAFIQIPISTVGAFKPTKSLEYL